MPPENANPTGKGGAGGNADGLDTPSIHRPDAESKFGVTLGAGKSRPQGRWHPLPVWSPHSLAEVLRRHTGDEAWFSLSRFSAGKTKKGKVVPDDYRDGGTFDYSVGWGGDIDTDGHRDLTPDERRVLIEAAQDGKFPGDLFYLTSAGMRLIRVGDGPTYDPHEFQRQAAEFDAEISDALDSLGLDYLQVDTGCTGDKARFFYTPNCHAKGRQRKSPVLILSGAKPLDAKPITGNAASLRRPKPRQGVVGVRRIRAVSGGAPHLVLNDDQRAEVEAAIKATVPASFGSRNDCLLMFLRRLKGISVVREATPQQLRPIIRSWWKRSKENHRDKDFSVTWTSTLSAWPSTQGEGAFLANALNAADAKPDPFAQLVTDHLAMRDEASFHRFVAFLCELDAASGGGVWFLSNDTAGEHIGVEGKTAWRWLDVLKKHGVLTEVEPPKKRQRRAARYTLQRDWTP